MTGKYLCTDTCIFPKYGEESYITVITSGKVMSLKGGETKQGTEVILETKVDADKQRWTRSRPTSDGYFTLQSKATSGSDLYLASTGDGKLTNGIAEGPPDIPKGINSILLVYSRKLHIEYFFCTAGRWKFDKGTDDYGSLTNGEKTTLAGKWKIPEKGAIDYISSDDEKNVLGLDDKGELKEGEDVVGYEVKSMKKIEASKRKFENNDYQLWERSDTEGDFVLINQVNKDKYYLYANADGEMSVGVKLNTTTKPNPPEPTPEPPPEPPTAGAGFKTIKISAIFIQLLLLAKLLMM